MTPKEDAQALVDALMPVAEQMISLHGEFYPFGGYMKPNGAIVHVSAMDGDTDRPKSKDVIDSLKDLFRQSIKDNKSKAAAIVFDVKVALRNTNSKSDAIQICVDHSENYSIEVFFPYQVEDGKVIYGETFAQLGKSEMLS